MSDERLLSRLDLNLLVALDALLTERNVTRAAARLQLSQPSLSASLGKLRRHFNDQLLARRGNSYDLTPLAVRLMEHTTVAMDSVRRVFESQSQWDPTESEREFIIHCSDYSLATIAPPVMRLAHERAPHVRLHFVPSTPGTVEEVVQRLPSIDGLVLPHGVISEVPHLDVVRDDWVAIAATGNEQVADGLTMEAMSESPWIFTYRTQSAFTSVGRQVELLGINPRIEAVVESFVMLPLFVEHSRSLAIIQRHLAPVALRMGDVQVLELPFEPVPVLNALWWHPVHGSDPEHRWLRSIFAEARIGFGDEPRPRLG